MDSSPDDFVKTARMRQPHRVTRTRTKKKPTKAETSAKNATKSTASTRSKAKEAVPVDQTCPCCGAEVESDFSVHVNVCLSRFSNSKGNQGNSSKENQENDRIENKKPDCAGGSKPTESNERCAKCSKTFASKRELSAHKTRCGNSEVHSEIDDFKPSGDAAPRAHQPVATKKTTKKRKQEDEQDSELQLALALSASLSQKGNLAGPSQRKGKDKNAKKGETLLKFRSKDARKALITERLGMVLMEGGDEEEEGASVRRASNYCSSHLKDLKQSDNLKWKLAGECLDNAAYQEFYVSALRDVVIPQSKPYQPQFRSWTQIPGREHTLLSQQITCESDEDDETCTQAVLEDLCDISDVHSMLEQTLKSAMEGPDFPDKIYSINKENEPPTDEEVKSEKFDLSSEEEIVSCSTQKLSTDSQVYVKCRSVPSNATKKLDFNHEKDESEIGPSEGATLKMKTSTPIVSGDKDTDTFGDHSPSTSSKNVYLSDTICIPSNQKEICDDANDDTILYPSQKAPLKRKTLFACDSASESDNDNGKPEKSSRRSQKETLSFSINNDGKEEFQQSGILESQEDSLPKSLCEDDGLELSKGECLPQSSQESHEENVFEFSGGYSLPKNPEENAVSESPVQSVQMNIFQDDTLLQSEQDCLLKTPRNDTFPKSSQETVVAGSFSKTLVEEDFQETPPKDILPKSPQEPVLPIPLPIMDGDSSGNSIFSDDTVIRSPAKLDPPSDSRNNLGDIFESLEPDDKEYSDVDKPASEGRTRKLSDHETMQNYHAFISDSNFSSTKACLLANWYDLWKTKRLSDVLVNCKDKTVLAHSLILQTQAEKLWEKCWDKDTRKINLTRWDSSVVDSLFCALYCGQIKTEERKGVLEIAEEYSISALVESVDKDRILGPAESVFPNVLESKMGEASGISVQREKSPTIDTKVNVLSREKVPSPGVVSVSSLNVFDVDADSDDLFCSSPEYLKNTTAPRKKSTKNTILSEDSDVEELMEVEAPSSFPKKRRLSSVASPNHGDGSFNNPFNVDDTSDEPKAKRIKSSDSFQMLADLDSIAHPVLNRSPEVLVISSDDNEASSCNKWNNLEEDRLGTEMKILPKIENKDNSRDSTESNPFDRSNSPNRLGNRSDSASSPPYREDKVPDRPKSMEKENRFEKSLLERCKDLMSKLEEEEKAESSNRYEVTETNRETESYMDDIWNEPDWAFNYEDCVLDDRENEDVQMDDDNRDLQEVNNDSPSPKIPSCPASPVCNFRDSSPVASFGSPQSEVKEGSGISKNISDTDSKDSTDGSLSSDKITMKKTNAATLNKQALEIDDKMAINELNLEDSILWRAENEPVQTPSTKPKSKKVTEKVTPLPDYKTMPTPALRKELGKYGLKQLSRKQATKMLSHIYEQLHPLEPKTPEQKDPQLPGTSTSAPNRKEDSAKENMKEKPANIRKNVSSEDESSGDECLEETFRENEMDDELTQTSSSDVNEAIRSYIARNPRLHENILQYEPIWLETLHKELKDAGIKCKMAHLMTLFDNECIIYRIAQNARNPSRRRKKGSPKKNQKKTGS